MITLAELTPRLQALEQKSSTSAVGWSASEVLQHCAQSIEFSISGYPKLKAGLIRATVGPMVKRKFLKAGAMKHDLAGPIPGAPPLDGAVSLGDALGRLRAAIASFEAHAGPLQPHFAYGPVPKDEYAQLHAMHVAEHLQALGC